LVQVKSVPNQGREWLFRDTKLLLALGGRERESGEGRETPKTQRERDVD
jgi:hypothetical protein